MTRSPLDPYSPYPTARPSFATSVVARPVYIRRRRYLPYEDWNLPTVPWWQALIDFLFIVLVTGLGGIIAGEVLSGYLVSLVDPESLQGDMAVFPEWAVQFAKGFWLAAILLSAWFVLWRHQLSPVVFGWPHRTDKFMKHFGATLLALLAAGMAWAFSTVVAGVLLISFPGLAEGDLQNRLDTLNQIPRSTWYMNAVLMLIVGMQEELLFRGMILPYLRRLSGSWVIAVMVSTLIFALAHFPQGAIAVIQIEFLALAFALVYLWTRSLVAVVMAHFLFNFVQIQIILPLMETYLKQYGPPMG